MTFFSHINGSKTAPGLQTSRLSRENGSSAQYVLWDHDIMPYYRGHFSWDPYWGDQTLHIYGNFVGFSL